MADRKKVIKGVERCLICDTSVIAQEEAKKAYLECEYTTGLYCNKNKLLRDVLELLTEQKTVKPYIDIDEVKCPDCKVRLTRQELLGDDVLFEDFFDYCPKCGKVVEWK